ncbi:MAG TPA: zf-HC2 domain-containing protein [Bacteroidota bacterium]
MNHNEIFLQLSAYVDHELSDAEKAVVVDHLRTCAECRKREHHLVLLKRNIRSAGDFELPYSFASSLARSIHHHEEVDVSWLGIERYAQRFVVGLAVLVLVLIGITSLRQTDESFPVERYVSGLTSDSAASQILTKHGTITRDDVLFAVLEK